MVLPFIRRTPVRYVLACLCLSGCAYNQYMEEERVRGQSLKQQMRIQNTETVHLKSESSQLQQRKNQLQGEINTLARKRNKLRKKQAANGNAAQQAEIDRLTAEIAELEKRKEMLIQY